MEEIIIKIASEKNCAVVKICKISITLHAKLRLEVNENNKKNREYLYLLTLRGRYEANVSYLRQFTYLPVIGRVAFIVPTFRNTI